MNIINKQEILSLKLEANQSAIKCFLSCKLNFGIIYIDREPSSYCCSDRLLKSHQRI